MNDHFRNGHFRPLETNIGLIHQTRGQMGSIGVNMGGQKAAIYQLSSLNHRI